MNQSTRESLTLGIAEIDEQHCGYFELVQRLGGLMELGESKQVVLEALDAMAEYVYEHFKTEDTLMKEMGYPEVEAHHEQHAVFVQKLIAFNRDFRAGKAHLDEEILRFLEQWFANHILSTDVKYVQYLKAQRDA